jgi:hypothetical protein
MVVNTLYLVGTASGTLTTGDGVRPRPVCTLWKKLAFSGNRTAIPFFVQPIAYLSYRQLSFIHCETTVFDKMAAGTRTKMAGNG